MTDTRPTTADRKRPPALIGSMEFAADTVSDPNRGACKRRKHDSSMTLFHERGDRFFIEWHVPALNEDSERIGLRISGKRLEWHFRSGPLPIQAVWTLRKLGYVVPRKYEHGN